MPDLYTQLYLHLVWATWDRAPYLVGETRAAVYACIRSECSDLNAEVLEIGGTEDHVHLFVRLPTTVAIGQLMKQAKGSSAHLANRLPSGDSFIKWQKGYGAFTVSRYHVDRVREYIRNQEQHHRDKSTIRDLETTCTDKTP